MPAPTATADPSLPARLQLRGSWTLARAGEVAQVLSSVPQTVRAIDARAVDALDTAGGVQLLHFQQQRGIAAADVDFSARHRALMDAIAHGDTARPAPRRDYGLATAFARLGEVVVRGGRYAAALAGFLGEVLVKLLRLVPQPRRLRLTSTVHHMEQVGLDAVLLIAVLCFLVGAVIAFLGATILAEFGATIFVVELVSIAFLREFGVLLTAILLAGRTASAFTAQIGAMVSREEVDAIRTLGLDVVELLVIPRLLALLAMLPLLTFIAMLAGLLGGLVVGVFSLDIPPQAYLVRMQQQMELRHMLVGLAKAPLFALVIALVGCLEGLKVTGTAQSLGERTTSSVVQAISLVIVLDAFAAIWFMRMGW